MVKLIRNPERPSQEHRGRPSENTNPQLPTAHLRMTFTHAFESGPGGEIAKPPARNANPLIQKLAAHNDWQGRFLLSS